MSRILLLILFVFISFGSEAKDMRKMVTNALKKEVLSKAKDCLDMEPITVTASSCSRSQGGIHDFYSEGDYWWPDPKNPDGPYIRRDGETNPDNFTAHRFAMVRLSQIVGLLSSAYALTGDKAYLDKVELHLKAWFIDPETKMNPNLEFAQAIKGVTKGRGIGIIDTLQLIEVAQSLYFLSESGAPLDESILNGVKRWFADYLDWMSTSKNGRDEMNTKNNHATCWALQASVFARLTGNEKILSLCRKLYKERFLPFQMAQDGSFPQEIARTKPYGYSLFNLDQMATLAIVLSNDNEDLWDYTAEGGRNMRKAADYMYPYVSNKSSWPFAHDVMFYEFWPVAQPFLLFSAVHDNSIRDFKVWKRLDHFPSNEEVIRNLPLRNPLIWLEPKSSIK